MRVAYRAGLPAGCRLREDAASHYFGFLKCNHVLAQTQCRQNSDRSSMEETEMLTVSAQPAKNSLGSTKMLFASVALASLVYLAGLIYYAQVRPLDGDEGYYTTAARLVWEGKTPYKDFSYPQGVLLPYIYSWIWAIHPRSLVSMRVLSAACGAMAVFLWGIWLISTRRLSATVAFATFAVILLNPYWAWWNVAVKTFAVANLLTSIAMICLYAALQSQRIKWYFIAGAALGACAAVRSLYAPLVPFVLVWLLQMEWRASKRGFTATLSFLGGAACGVLPMLFSFVSDPQAFVFNNINYRRLLSPHESLRHTVHVYLNNLLSLLHHTYFVATILLALVGVLSLLKRRNGRESALQPPGLSLLSAGISNAAGLCSHRIDSFSGVRPILHQPSPSVPGGLYRGGTACHFPVSDSKPSVAGGNSSDSLLARHQARGC